MTTTRRAILGGLALTPVAFSLPSIAQTASASPDALLDSAFAEHAPFAMAVAVVTAQGLSWSGVRGVRKAGGDPVTPDDRWHLGSNTKAMTAALFARLVEQGRARWAIPLSAAFPTLTIDPAWSAITLDDLMTHTAGLKDADVIGRPWLMTARADPRTLPEQRAAIAAAALSVPPTGTPGQFQYGNANYILLGAAIEAITGGSWEDSMRAEVFSPLGMTSAGFGPPADPNAWGHRATAAGLVAMTPGPGADNPAALGPAGTAHMTVADYARFVSAMIGGSQTWLKPETIRLLTTPAPGATYARGWIARQEPWAGVSGPGPTLAHEGTNTMWHAIVIAAPERNLAFIALANDFAQGRKADVAFVQGMIAAQSHA